MKMRKQFLKHQIKFMPPEKNFQYPKGSVWRKLDLQVQTILDDGYVSLASYSADIKAQNPVGWQQYTTNVGGEENALLFDSKEHYSDSSLGGGQDARELFS